MNRNNAPAAQNSGRNIDSAECLSGYPIAMAYVPRQRFENLYCPETGLQRGTVFEALDLPFMGETVSGYEQGGNCRG